MFVTFQEIVWESLDMFATFPMIVDIFFPINIFIAYPMNSYMYMIFLPMKILDQKSVLHAQQKSVFDAPLHARYRPDFVVLPFNVREGLT